MRTAIPLALSAIASSVVAFFIHKPIADNLPRWIGEQMASAPEIKRPPYGLEVAVPAAVSSIEYGLAFAAGYLLLRKATPHSTILVRALLLFLLALAFGGNVLRFPVMQLVIGNPVGVTLVQHAGTWLPYLAGALTVAYVYEFISKRVA